MFQNLKISYFKDRVKFKKKGNQFFFLALSFVVTLLALTSAKTEADQFSNPSAPIYFSQKDPRWSGVPFNAGTVGPDGCVPTSIAMVLAGSYGFSVDPGQIAIRLDGFSSVSHGATGNDLIKTVNSYGLVTEEITDKNRAIQLLQQGYPVVFYVNVGIGHAVVAYGYNGGVTQVLDPYNRMFYPSGSASVDSLWNIPSNDPLDWDAGRPAFAIKNQPASLPIITGTSILGDPNSGHFQVEVDTSGGENFTVQVPIWSQANGQDDLFWYPAEKVSDGKYVATFNPDNHDYASGNYTIDAYAFAGRGTTAVEVSSSLYVGAGSSIPAGTSAVYRVYNPVNMEHFYTSSLNERNTLVRIGWGYSEGISYYAPNLGAAPVYRLYNPSIQMHHYTTDKNEYNVLGRYGWNQEGIAFYAATKETGDKPVYRMYNPQILQHLFTTDQNEYNVLGKYGWNQEGISWYGVTESLTPPSPPGITELPPSSSNVLDQFTLENISSIQYTWIQTVAPMIIEKVNLNNFYASVALAQGIKESNWGMSDLAQNANNLFGLKADSNWTGETYSQKTEEVVSGETTMVTTNFRKYETIQDSIDDYVSNLKTTMSESLPRYANTFKDQASNYSIAAQNLQADGYSTSPTYAQDLITCIQTYNLSVADQ